MKTTCLIIDDEQTARQGLEALCSEYPQLKVIQTCNNGVEAIDSIRSYQPDLVLLDIQMPKVDGFEVLASIPPPLPEIIFVTAYDEFAIKAFEVNAVDYLLKPFSDERFDAAIKRTLERVRTSNLQQPLNALIKGQKYGSKGIPEIRDSDDHRLIIKANGSIHILLKEEIIQVEAYDYYVKVHTTRQLYLVRETMKNMELTLPATLFMRIHKSYIVNKRFIRSLVKNSTEYELMLTNNQITKVSRTKVQQLKEWIS